MSDKINDGGPAFPLQSIGPDFPPGYAGMSLRDYFAAKAMHALVQERCFPYDIDTGRLAYEIADAMLKARMK